MKNGKIIDFLLSSHIKLKYSLNTTLVAIEGEKHFCDFAIHTNNDDCDSPPKIDTRFVH